MKDNAIEYRPLLQHHYLAPGLLGCEIVTKSELVVPRSIMSLYIINAESAVDARS